MIAVPVTVAGAPVPMSCRIRSHARALGLVIPLLGVFCVSEAGASVPMAYGQGGAVQPPAPAAASAQDEVQQTRQAAEQGDANAQFRLGAMYANGQGVGQDFAQAAQWWRRAAEQGQATAQFGLGTLYDSGTGVAQDHAQAIQWYR
jgi:TPR repeat protein